jgi:APA family basic amino acid/polyamine antiporter
MATGAAANRLARKLSLVDAVFIGLGAMIGAGIFAAIAPAADAAESWLLVSLAIAAGVALCNALSSAQLAALYPEAGGTYVYGRERLGHVWGYLAGWGFVIGKTASCAAMALTFGFYVYEDAARPLAVAAVVAFTLINVTGVEKTARVAMVLVITVVATLIVVVASTFGIDDIDVSQAFPGEAPPGGLAVLQGAALLFFAFAGYARIATLGEEVERPERTIPRAIPIALAIVVTVYALVIASALIALSPEGLASAKAPLVDTVNASGLDAFAPVVRIGAALATLSVLLSLLAGVSRTAFAMARLRDFPAWLDAVHPRYRVPHRAELVVGAIVAVLAATLDLRSAIGFSSFAVLFYYAVANASAWTLSPAERRWPRWIAGAGVAGCVALAVSLPWTTLVAGVTLFAIGITLHLLRRRARTD